MNSPWLEVNKASFTYGERQVLDEVALSVAPGEIYLLLGPNGAGKSTLVRAITGQIRLDSGSVRVGGADPASSASARQAIGVVPQNIALYEKLNARENMQVIGRLMGVPRAGIQMRITDMLERIKLVDRSTDRAETLSGGMRRRLNIGAALLHDPSLLILDEPTVGVDHAGRRALRDLLLGLRDSGLAILLTTHDMAEAEALADRVGIIVAGRIRAEGTPREVVHRYFGDAVELVVQLEDADAAASEPRIAGAFCQLGLSHDASTGQWRGLVEPGETAVQRTLRELMCDTPSARDVRLRRPGLDTLFGRLTDRREP